jgi:hypothetical protein
MKTSLALALACAAILVSPRTAVATQDKATHEPAAKDATKDPKEKPAARPVSELQFVPSSFSDSLDDPKLGKDIFFPQTKRLSKRVDTAANTQAHIENQILSQLTLKGISGGANRRLAVVNNRTLAQGEVFELRLNGHVHRIRCDEIKARSVVLSIEGVSDKKEIQLRGGL